MAYTVPDGTKVYMSKTLAAAVAIALSKAEPAVATSQAPHGIVAGKEFIILDAWEEASNRVFRAGAAPTETTLAVLGLDTTHDIRFAEGGGEGRLVPIAAWIEIKQVLSPSTSGGEQQFATADPLASDSQIQVPTSKTAVSITVPIADDPTLAGYKAWVEASNNREEVALKFVKPNGETSYFFGFPSINENQSQTKGQVQTVTASFSPQGRITRYPRTGA